MAKDSMRLTYKMKCSNTKVTEKTKGCCAEGDIHLPLLVMENKQEIRRGETVDVPIAVGVALVKERPHLFEEGPPEEKQKEKEKQKK